jgi:hypothetical protein
VDEDVGHEGEDGALEGGDADGADDVPGGGGQAGLGLLQLGQDDPGVRNEELASAVSRTRRPTGSRSGVPASCSRTPSCWDTAYGL